MLAAGEEARVCGGEQDAFERLMSATTAPTSPWAKNRASALVHIELELALGGKLGRRQKHSSRSKNTQNRWSSPFK